MRAFNEKCDKVLKFLKDNGITNWHIFFIVTGIKQNDGIISYLKKTKYFVDYSDDEINITQQGLDFISKTSFVEQRDKVE